MWSISFVGKFICLFFLLFVLQDGLRSFTMVGSSYFVMVRKCYKLLDYKEGQFDLTQNHGGLAKRTKFSLLFVNDEC